MWRGRKRKKKKEAKHCQDCEGGKPNELENGMFCPDAIHFVPPSPACLPACSYTVRTPLHQPQPHLQPPPPHTPAPHPSQKNSSAGTRYPKVKVSILSKVPVGNNTAEKKCKEFNLFLCCLLAHPPPFGSQDVTSSLSPPTLASCRLLYRSRNPITVMTWRRQKPECHKLPTAG